jgi:3-hydroxyacyl-CoA dehydrogenase/enoyl-CoA hydratase/3-hydroxybutyryl-CoA epimerase
MDTTAVDLKVDLDHIGWLSFDLPGSSVNLLTAEVMREMDHRLGELESHIATGKLAAVVVISGKPGTFFAGADVREIVALEDVEDARNKSREGQRIFRRLERLTVPTIAAVDGLCLGGATELALACDYRIASDRPQTRIGLPEIKLGIVPGFGGCVRLPRLVGIQRALRMIVSGSAVNAERARRMGLVDRVANYERFEAAVADFVREALEGQVERHPPRLSLAGRLLENSGPGRQVLFSTARRQTAKRTDGRYPAPLRAISVVQATHGKPIDQALPIEAEALAEMSQTDVSRNLVRIFLLQQAAKRSLPAEQLDRRAKVEKAAVLGAGVMGGSIAELIAAHDVPVVLKDIDREALDDGLRHASALLKKGGERGVFEPEEVGLKFALIHGTLTYEKFDDVDLVIEAVVERMPVKQTVLRETEERASDDCVFATNTSSLSVAELASAAARPGRVVGLHFFNPVHRMPLVEVVRIEGVSDEALATAFGFTIDLGKTPVLVADRPGFLVNRLLTPYLNEAGYLLEEGTAVEDVDGALLEFGMPMGPCRLLDEIGFDVAEHVAHEMEAAFGRRMQASPVVSLLRQEGRLGKKNARGFYAYTRGRQQGVDREVATTLSGRGGDPPPGTNEIQRRCLYSMVNEAAFTLAEDVVDSAGTLDLAMVMGTGFPPFRGGLLRWADGEGIQTIVEALREYQRRLGPRFAPASLLTEMAASGRTFTEPV